MITRFGTASEMVVQTVEENNVPFLLAIDQKGLYLTTDRYVDKNLSDPNRNSNRALMEERITALGFDYKAFYEENKHLVKDLPKSATVKVNPLKASKRSMKK